jgi:hypothetical protein
MGMIDAYKKSEGRKEKAFDFGYPVHAISYLIRILHAEAVLLRHRYAINAVV